LLYFVWPFFLLHLWLNTFLAPKGYMFLCFLVSCPCVVVALCKTPAAALPPCLPATLVF
jgi:hypothetical protein